MIKAVWQAAGIAIMGVACVLGGEDGRGFKWDPPVVPRSMFTQDLGMLDAERDEYATNLVNHSASQVLTAKASASSLATARRMIALALHLSPRNKRALVTSFQLTKGMLPDPVQPGLSPQAFARLLFTRGQLLEKQGGDENGRLARLFIQLAATIDPRNEDAVYACEVHRLDHGPVDWAAVTDCAKEPP